MKKTLKVKVMKLDEKAVLPIKAHPSDAGADLTAISTEFDTATGNYIYHTGLAFEIPEGYVGYIFPRSSVFKTDMHLTNCVGVIDSHYRGEVTARFQSNLRFPTIFSVIKYDFQNMLNKLMKKDKGVDLRVSNTCHPYKVGERFGQIIIMPYPEVSYEESEDLSETDRGANGYGSTGK